MNKLYYLKIRDNDIDKGEFFTDDISKTLEALFFKNSFCEYENSNSDLNSKDVEEILIKNNYFINIQQFGQEITILFLNKQVLRHFQNVKIQFDSIKPELITKDMTIDDILEMDYDEKEKFIKFISNKN